MTDQGRGIPRAALSLGLVAILAVALLAGMSALTRARIAEAEKMTRLQALAIVLPPDRYDNDLLVDRVSIAAPAWLGSGQSQWTYRARLRGRPSALVLEAVASDGYAGPIHLLIAIDADGRVRGVRVTAHQETPGLGDAIETAKSAWLDGFRGKALGDPAADLWKVKRDGGQFDQFASATLTPRAVVRAVRLALAFNARHSDEVYRAPNGATLDFADAPEAGTTP